MDNRTVRRESRTITIDLGELDLAFDNGMDEASWYLDLETGRVLLVTDDSRTAMAQILEEIEPDDDEASVRAALEQSDFPDWLRDSALEAHQVETGIGTRYIEIPGTDSRTGYGEMEDFIETVADEAVQHRLLRAIDGRGAFRRFKDELFDYPEERERWFAFRDSRLRERSLMWLSDEGFEQVSE